MTFTASGASSPPLLSILVVSYRNPELTARCLDAVAEHCRSLDAEVLVLDNASPDRTAETIAERFPWVQLTASDSNLGFARANNVLARQARGRYLLLLNPDAILHPGAIEALLEIAERHPRGGSFGGRTVRPSGELDPSSCWGFQTLWSAVCFATGLSHVFAGNLLLDPESLGGWQRDSVREVDVVTGCLLLIGRDVWHELDGFDEAFWLYGEDQDLAIRLRRAGYPAMITPEATVTHVVSASSDPGKTNRMVLGARAHLMRKHWSPARARAGIALLQVGCLLRAAAADTSVGWRDSWRCRREWRVEGA